MPIQPATASLICVKGNKTGTVTQVFAKDSLPALPNLALGYAKGITFGGPTSMNTDGTFGRNLQIGVEKNTTDGSPFSQPPSLQLTFPGFWRFRWSVQAGVRSLYINTKQTLVSPNVRPSVIIKANANVGLNSDLSMSASDSNDWVTVGPLTFAATAAGMVWVELWNNCQQSNCPALFDHIVTT